MASKIVCIDCSDANWALRDLEEQLLAIREAPGRDEFERWPADREPKEYRELDRQYTAAYDDLSCGCFGITGSMTWPACLPTIVPNSIGATR